MGLGHTRNRRRSEGSRPGAGGLQAAVSALGGGLAAMAALGLFAVASWLGADWAQRSPSFALKQVSFSGHSRATEAELLRLAGVAPGVNLFSIDRAAAEKAMSSHPWVKSVSVARHPPSRLSVSVTEHVPAAIASLGDLYLVDESGEPFKRVQGTKVLGLDLPLITGVDRERYVEKPEEVEALFRRALEVGKAYGRRLRGQNARLSEVRLEGEAVTVVANDGLEIRLGEGDLEKRLDRLEQVRGELAKRGLAAAVIHLDNRVRPGWVTVKLLETAKESLRKDDSAAQ